MSSLPSPLPAPLVELIAQRFRLLGEPNRIRLLDALRDGPATAADLQSATGASQQNVSKHLSMMVEAGMVRREKEGTRVRFSIADDTLFELCERVCGSLRQQVQELDALLQGQPAGGGDPSVGPAARRGMPPV
ncbi:MAG TPA: metalloregulator ArsR/SmtB family transcription factor [Acidimicrobiales bacterium]|nr:metalloregulator ArsR/SmtB family transcription factor [Acidimicrobiales bacterium]